MALPSVSYLSSVSLTRVSGLAIVCFENRAVARVSDVCDPTLPNQSR